MRTKGDVSESELAKGKSCQIRHGSRSSQRPGVGAACVEKDCSLERFSAIFLL